MPSNAKKRSQRKKTKKRMGIYPVSIKERGFLQCSMIWDSKMARYMPVDPSLKKEEVIKHFLFVKWSNPVRGVVSCGNDHKSFVREKSYSLPQPSYHRGFIDVCHTTDPAEESMLIPCNS